MALFSIKNIKYSTVNLNMRLIPFISGLNYLLSFYSEYICDMLWLIIKRNAPIRNCVIKRSFRAIRGFYKLLSCVWNGDVVTVRFVTRFNLWLRHDLWPHNASICDPARFVTKSASICDQRYTMILESKLCRGKLVFVFTLIMYTK